MNYKISCKSCKKEFFSSIDSSHRKYCDECRFKNCLVCRKRILVKPGVKSGVKKLCSKSCANRYAPFALTEDGKKRMIQKVSLIHKGRKNTIETRMKMSDSARGSKNHCYINGSSKHRTKLYETIFYKDWRKSVFTRDNYTCQTCKNRGGKLQAHHIKRWALFPNLRFDVSNGLTLCDKCHLEETRKEHKIYWKNQYSK